MDGPSAARPTVGLSLIARDEETTLPRLLASCAGAFDEVVLVDTGSADGTVERFLEWAATQPDARCRVQRFAWIDDFGAARQTALDALSTDWCSWADCDDEIRGAGALRGLAASAPPDVVAFTGRYDYAASGHGRHVRLVRRGAARWSGAIHEVLGVQTEPGRLEHAPEELVRWVHLPPPRPDVKPRMHRDLEILEATVRADPGDARATFYLAQTCRDLGRRGRAIELYRRRADLPGWDEETYYARYQAGVLLSESGAWPQAMHELMAAWELRPGRLEALQALSAGLRVQGHYRSAHRFATAGLEVPPTDDHLFVAHWIHDWGMLFEYSITAYWVGDLAGALDACDRLLARDDLFDVHREQTVSNRRLCLAAIEREAARRSVSA
jgi:hypothetical protein